MRGLRIFGLILPAFLAMTSARAQQSAAGPSLDDVLTRVAVNFHAYVQSIPNLYAEEQLTTDRTSSLATTGSVPWASSHGVAADALFYLRRSPGGRLVESRELKSIDHKPVKEDEKLETPVMEVDVFSYGTSFISAALRPCYDYKLKTNQRLQKQPVLIVEYQSKKLTPRTACPVHEPHSGRAFVDPDTMQVLRMEQLRPAHPIADMLKNTPFREVFEDDATGAWKWAVDFAPVELNGKTFWLPKTISASTTTNHAPLVKWTFLASYRNYHLLTVKSKVLPGYTVQH